MCRIEQGGKVSENKGWIKLVTIFDSNEWL